MKRLLRAAVAGVAVSVTGVALLSCGSGGVSRNPGAPAASCAPMPSRHGQLGADDPSFELAPVALCVVGSTRAPADPHQLDLAALIPRGRVRQVWFLRGGHLADQVLVEWIDQRRPAVEREGFPSLVRWGLTVWQRASGNEGVLTIWTGATIPVVRSPPAATSLAVSVGDVTSDGHPDLLIAQYPDTNHGCGPHQVIAALPDGHAWRVFSGAPMCETEMAPSHGLLKVVGPIYRRGDAVCCPTFTETTYRRWTGDHFRIIRRQLARNHDR